jgi:VanZ family protein
MKKFDLRRHWTLALLTFLVALTVLFIWGNSCLSRETSGAQSGRITALLLRILDPKGKLDADTFHHFVRKTAHFAEFALLGAWIGGLFQRIRLQSKKTFYTLPVLCVLLVAVLDEYIQFFTGRGSAVTDVMLDFAGGLTGLAIVVIFLLLRRKIKK